MVPLAQFSSWRRFDILRGKNVKSHANGDVFDNMNLPLPSRRTMQSAMPKYSFGNVDEATISEILQEAAQLGRSQECFLSWDEMVSSKKDFVYLVRKFVQDLSIARHRTKWLGTQTSLLDQLHKFQLQTSLAVTLQRRSLNFSSQLWTLVSPSLFSLENSDLINLKSTS